MDFLYQRQQHEGSTPELKMMEKREVKSAYVGANLQTSRTPSAIDHHCRSSYKSARRKLHSSRAKVRFYVAGENNHNAIYAVSPQRFASFDSLLGSLTKTPICSQDINSERCVFSLNGSHKITALDELHPGESYVCATYEVFQQLSEEKERPISSANRYQTLHNAALAAARLTHTSQSSRSQRNAAQESQLPKEEHSEESQFIAELKPKLITVLRGGAKPRRSVRILLSKKNTRSFEQTVAGIGEILCAGEPIKRLFGTSGRLVMCLADFYLEDSVFVAYSHDKMNPDDLCLDETEVRFVGAYRFRKASAYGRVTLTSHQKGLGKQKSRSIQISPSPDINRVNNESRSGSRMKSGRPSLAPTPDRPPICEEKHIQNGMEKISRTPSHSSIKTAASESEQSKESVHLTSSPASNMKSVVIHSGAQSVVVSAPPTPAQSPSRKRHSSVNSQTQTAVDASGKAPRSSTGQTPDVSKSQKSLKSNEEPLEPNSNPELNQTLSSSEPQNLEPVPSQTSPDLDSKVSAAEEREIQVLQSTVVEEQKTEAPKSTRSESSGSHSSIQESLHSQKLQKPLIERSLSSTSNKSVKKLENSRMPDSLVKSRHESNSSKTSVESVVSKQSMYSSAGDNPTDDNKSNQASEPKPSTENTSKASSRKSSISSVAKSTHSSSPRSAESKLAGESPRTKSVSRASSKQSMQSKLSSESKKDSTKEEQASVTENPSNNQQEKEHTSRPASQNSRKSVASKSPRDFGGTAEEQEKRADNIENGSLKSIDKSEGEREESVVNEDQYSVDFENTAQDTDDSQDAVDEKIPNSDNAERDASTL